MQGCYNPQHCKYMALNTCTLQENATDFTHQTHLAAMGSSMQHVKTPKVGEVELSFCFQHHHKVTL